MDVNDDPESPDAAPLGDTGFDLTPRTSAATKSGPKERNPRKAFAIGALVAVAAALAFVLLQGLNDAATFFYNVDEAVARKTELGTDRFRMQGNVTDGSVEETPEGVSFVLRFNGVEVPVEHTGTPPELFGPDIPVVLEGAWDGDTFASDEILIRHDNEYDEKNADRVADAERDAQSAPVPGDGSVVRSAAAGAGPT